MILEVILERIVDIFSSIFANYVQSCSGVAIVPYCAQRMHPGDDEVHDVADDDEAPPNKDMHRTQPLPIPQSAL